MTTIQELEMMITQIKLMVEALERDMANVMSVQIAQEDAREIFEEYFTELATAQHDLALTVKTHEARFVQLS